VPLVHNFEASNISLKKCFIMFLPGLIPRLIYPPCFPGQAPAIWLVCCLALLVNTGKAQNDLRLTVNISNPTPLPVCEIVDQEIRIENKSSLAKSGSLDVQLPEGFHFSPGHTDEKWQSLSTDHWQRQIHLPALQTTIFKLSLHTDLKASQSQGNIRVWITDAGAQQVRMSEVPIKPLKIAHLDGSAEGSSSVGSKYPDASTGCDEYTYFVSGEFVVTEEQYFESRLTHFVMAPGSEIRIKPGGQLNLRNALFTACDGQWNGIVVEAGGILKIDNTVIEQAVHPILYENRTALQGNLQIYPNPASDKVYFLLSTSADAPQSNSAQIMLTDPSGRVYSIQANNTAQENLFEADILNLPNGMYHAILVFSDGNAFPGEILIARN